MSALELALSRQCPACGAKPRFPCTALRWSARFNVDVGDKLKYTHPERDPDPQTGWGRVHNQEKVQ